MAQFTNMKAMHRKPFYVIAGVYPANLDLSWIPDAGFTLPLVSPSETPDGLNVSFTFASVPKAVMWNGIWYLENYGYTRSGYVITFRDADSLPVAPETGAIIRAVQ